MKPENVIKRLGDSLNIAYIVRLPLVRRAFGHRTKVHSWYLTFDDLAEINAWRARVQDRNFKVNVKQFRTIEDRNQFIRQHPEQ